MSMNITIDCPIRADLKLIAPHLETLDPIDREQLRPAVRAVESDVEVIHVEHIVTAAVLHEEAYHEEIADDLHGRFKWRQILKAHHHGVDIETRRGFE